MKLYIFLSLLLLSKFVFSQNSCDHDVSTDPQNPSNSALPVGINAQKYLNKFNWFPVTPAGEYDDYPCTNISFGGVQYPEMNSILLSSMDFYDYLEEGPLPLTQNGWELLLVNVGRYPDDVTEITAGNYLYGLPYIVIYNRYSGVIRIFMNYGLDGNVGGDAIKFTLKFRDNTLKTGLLRYNLGQDVTLDEPSGIVSVSGVVKGPAFGQQWASTDIRVAYDPCTCFYKSGLKIIFEQISSSTVTLQGRGIELTNQPLVNNTTLEVNPNDYLSNFQSSDNILSGSGIAMHKSVQKMIDDYTALYEKYNHDLVDAQEHNVKVKRNLAILKAAKFVSGAIQLAVTGGFALPTPELLAEQAQELAAAETLGMTAAQINEAYQGLGVTTWWEAISAIPGGLTDINNAGNNIINTEEIFKTVAQIFGEKGKLFIANNFTEKKPTPPAMPSANFSEMRYVGTITTLTPVDGPEFYTPGTYGGSFADSMPVITNVYEYPVYNEVLGTFALLNSPKIQIWESGQLNLVNKYENKIVATGSSVHPYEVETARYKSWDKNYELKIKEDLKYVFNTALDIKSTKVQASFNVIAKLNDVSVPEKAKFSVCNNSQWKANANSNTMDLDAEAKIVNYGYDFGTYSTNLDFDETHFDDSTDFNLSVNRSNDTIGIQTPYLPIDAFFPVVSRFGLKNEFISYDSQLINSDEYYNSNIFYGDQEFPFILNADSPVLTDKATNFDPANGYEYNFEIELKLIVDIVFNTLNQYGENNSITHVLTYKIDTSNIEYYPQPMSYTTFLPELTDLSQFQFDMTLNGGNFNGQEVNGCQKVGNVYTCQAMNNLLITDDIQVSPGYFVNLFGGNTVTVVNESIISPESLLAINKVLDFSHPMPNATPTYVQTFCEDTLSELGYKAFSAGKSIIGNDAQPVTDLFKDIDFSFDFTLFPNPSNGIVQIYLTQKTNPVNIIVIDMMGKELPIAAQFVENGKMSIDLSGYSSGVYMVKVSTLNGVLTKQLIKQ